MLTEDEVIKQWQRFYEAILTSEYRAAFLIAFDKRLLPKLLVKLGIHTAEQLIVSMRGK